jgi:hypothetical protein
MGMLVRFLNFWAGVDSDLLELCPHHEQQKYLTQGTLVLLTGFFAFMSSGYAIFTVFGDAIISVSLGLTWGFLIINFDRLLLLTYSKYGPIAKRVLTALIRLCLALLVGIIVAHPLVLKLFEPELLAQIGKDQVVERDREGERYKNNLNKAQKNRDDEIAKLSQALMLKNRTEEVKHAKDELDACDAKHYDLLQQELCEADGTCGTGSVGKRGIFTTKKNAADEQENKCRDLRTKLPILMDNQITAERALAITRQLQDDSYATAKTAIDLDHAKTLKVIDDEKASLLSRTEALEEISRGRPMTVTSRRAVSLMFVLIEIIPILAKIMSPRDSADRLARAVRKQFLQHIPNLSAMLADPEAFLGESDVPGQGASSGVASTTGGSSAIDGDESDESMAADDSENRESSRVLALNLGLSVAITVAITAGLLLSGSNTGEACGAGTLFVTVAALYMEHRRRSRRLADSNRDTTKTGGSNGSKRGGAAGEPRETNGATTRDANDVSGKTNGAPKDGADGSPQE